MSSASMLRPKSPSSPCRASGVPRGEAGALQFSATATSSASPTRPCRSGWSHRHEVITVAARGGNGTIHDRATAPPSPGANRGTDYVALHGRVFFEEGDDEAARRRGWDHGAARPDRASGTTARSRSPSRPGADATLDADDPPDAQDPRRRYRNDPGEAVRSSDRTSARRQETDTRSRRRTG